MSTQSNPVVFITMGNGADTWPLLSAAIKDYAEGVGYIQIPSKADNLDETWIKAEIGRVWRELMQSGQNSSDVIRVSYLLGTDDEGLMFPDLHPLVEKYFTALYPAGVMTDVYCMLDDDKLLENSESRKAILRMLEEQAETVRVYLLSNLTSQNIFAPDDIIPHTIALLTLFKDCVPDLYVTGPDASRYNEFYFSENCYTRHGRFLTASCLNLTIPKDALKSLLMSELLSFGKDEVMDDNLHISLLSELPEQTAVSVNKTLDFLCGIAIPEVRRGEHLTRRQWLTRLFGQRLDYFLPKTEELEAAPLNFDSLENTDINIYDLLRYTAQGGECERDIIRTIIDAEKNLRSMEEKCNLWLEEMPKFEKGSPSTAKKRLSLFASQELWPYVLAQEFLYKQSKVAALKNNVALLEKKQQSIENFHHKILKFIEKVDEKIDQCNKNVLVLDDAFAAFTYNGSAYFRLMFKEYAKENRRELLEISKEMIDALRHGKFNAYLTKLEDVIENNILTSAMFARPIMDIINDLAVMGGQSDMTIALGEWVSQRRYWNIRLKIGYTSLYTETNLYMPSRGAADVKRIYEERGLGRMNLFAEVDADRVAVLYHAGAFSLEDLYYGGLYVGE